VILLQIFELGLSL